MTTAAESRMLVFEPGTKAKTSRLFRALSSVGSKIGINSVTIISTHNKEDILPDETPPLDIIFIKVERLDQIPTLTSGHQFDAVIAPYEHSVLQAAQWCDQNRIQNFHSIEAAQISRNKRSFREFVSQFRDMPHFDIREHAVVRWDPAEIRRHPNTTARQILTELRASNLGDQLVIKPTNASGSMGVRAISLSGTSAESGILHTIEAISRMKSEQDILELEGDSLVAEPFVRGEEFSVEVVANSQSVRTLAVHWKPGMADHDGAFIERCYVSLPSCAIRDRLTACAETIVTSLPGRGPGVFHAEFRVGETGTIYPLEVGLRPGGGMVNELTFHSTGTSLFDWLLLATAPGTTLQPVDISAVAGMGLLYAHARGVLSGVRVGTSDEVTSLAEIGGFLRGLSDQIEPSNSTTTLPLLFADLPTGYTGGPWRVEDVEVFMKTGESISESEGYYVAGFIVSTGCTPGRAPLAECTNRTLGLLRACRVTLK